jgi:WD40 repeat protein
VVGTALREFETISAISRDGRKLAIPESDRIAIWDLNSGERQAALTCDGNQVMFAPDGLSLAVSDRESGALRVFDSGSGRELAGLRCEDLIRRCRPDLPSAAPLGWLVVLGYSPDGKSVAINSVIGTAIWDIGKDKVRNFTAHLSRYRVLACASNGRTMALFEAGSSSYVYGSSNQNSSPALVICDAQNDRARLELETADRSTEYDCAFSLDCTVLAVARKGEFSIRETSSGRKRNSFQPAMRHYKRPVFSSDSSLIAVECSGEYGKSLGVALLDTSSGAEKAFLRGSENPVFLNDGQTLVTFDPGSRTLQFWDIPPRWTVNTVFAHLASVVPVALSVIAFVSMRKALRRKRKGDMPQ